MSKAERTFCSFLCRALKSTLHEKAALEFRFAAARAIIQLYLTSASLKEPLGYSALHGFFSHSHRRVFLCGSFTFPDSGVTFKAVCSQVGLNSHSCPSCSASCGFLKGKQSPSMPHDRHSAISAFRDLCKSVLHLSICI